MGKMIGWIFVGGTLVLAAADGVLIAMLIAAGAAAVTYKVVNGTILRPSELIFEREESEYRKLMRGTQDKELIKQYRDCIKQLREKKEVDQQGISNMAKLVAVATFNTPFLAVGTAAYLLTRNKEKLAGRPAVAHKVPDGDRPLDLPADGSPVKFPDGIVREGNAVVLQRPT